MVWAVSLNEGRPDSGFVGYRGGMVEQTFGYLRRIDDAGRVAMVAPTHCRQGHRLGPSRCLVGFVRCSCTPKGSHITWTCRVRDCGDIQYSDGHDADVMLYESPPAMLPSLFIDD